MASSKREKELARQRAARQAARRAEQERRRKQRAAVVAGVVAVLVVVGGVGFAAFATRDDDGTDQLASPTAAPTATPTEGATADPTADPSTELASGECSYAPEGEAAKPVELPPAEVEREQAYTAVLRTSAGDLPLELTTADAPCTVHSFRHLALSDYFDDTPCHRLTDQGIFVLQCGDPSGTGRGGPGYSFADENLEGATYPRGTLAMANSGPDTNGSQFFLVYQDSTLPPQYTPFGRIGEAGLTVLDQIAAAGASPPNETGNTAPNTPVQITDVVVEPAAP